MKGQAEQFTAFGQQHVIHAHVSTPTETIDLPYFFGGQGQAVLDFRPQAEGVPAQSIVERSRRRWESDGALPAASFCRPKAGHDTAAFSADINSEINLLIHKESQIHLPPVWISMPRQFRVAYTTIFLNLGTSRCIIVQAVR